MESQQRRRALEILFGDGTDWTQHSRGHDWVRRLRSAYRRRAHETHPDRAAVLGRSAAELAGEFQRVHQAYELLRSLPHPPLASAPAAPAPTPARAARPASSRRAGPEDRSEWRSARAATSTAPRGRDAAGEASSDPARRPGPRRTGPAAAGAATSASTPRYHHGAVPARPLRFAEFLYYSGYISWQTLIGALCWQQQQHPAIGRLAVSLGFLSHDQVFTLLDRRLREGRVDQRFGEFAIERGALSRFQLLVLLGMQRRLRRRIGEFFVERGLLSPEELERLLGLHAEHARAHQGPR